MRCSNKQAALVVQPWASMSSEAYEIVLRFFVEGELNLKRVKKRFDNSFVILLQHVATE